MIDWFPVIIAMTACLMIIVVRIFIGPGAPTRLVAFDTANTLVVASLVIVGMMFNHCLLYTSPSPRDRTRSRMPSSA